MTGSLPEGTDWRGLQVVVMGLGQFGGGVAAARYLVRMGAHVCVTDLRDEATLQRSITALRDLPIRFVLGRHAASDFEKADLVVANPAVPPSAKWLQIARERGIPITSEMELFLRECRGTLLLVSGTHGKSSAVHFLYQIVRGWRTDVYLGGNLGRPLLDEPAAQRPEALCIVEISSYQLEALPPGDTSLQKATGVGLTALAPDHLERHGDVDSYFEAKTRLFDLCKPGGSAFLPNRVQGLEPFASTRSRHEQLNWSTYGESGELRWTPDEFWIRNQALRAPTSWDLGGDFQRHNVLLALGLAHSIGMPMEVAAKKLPHLSSLPHRMQNVPTGEGDATPRVIDNGVSTTPESTLAGLHSLESPAVLLLGGQAKAGLDYEPLLRACALRGDSVFAFGAAAQTLAMQAEACGANLLAFHDLSMAFDAAWEAVSALDAGSSPPGTLLFSPACASFDAYPNFRARALEFLELVAARCSDISHSETEN